jgi:hypothetical protein
MAELSAGAKKILRYLRGLGQAVYATPAELGAIFDSFEECEAAQAELERRGLVDLGPSPHPATPIGPERLGSLSMAFGRPIF